MSDTGTTIAALERNWGMVDAAIADLDDSVMAACPNDQSNSISWLLWHMTRVADRFIYMRLQDAPQLWITEGWSEKFAMAHEPDDFGMGWSTERVKAWQPPPKEVQTEYYAAVNSAARAYINSLTAKDLERQIPFPALPDTISVGGALGVLVWDNIVHGGQIAYLRGYYKGMGWHR